MAEASRKKSLLQDANVGRWHDNVARGSEITADVYARRLEPSADNSTSLAELLELNQNQIRNVLLDMVAKMKKEGDAGSDLKMCMVQDSISIS